MRKLLLVLTAIMLLSCEKEKVIEDVPELIPEEYVTEIWEVGDMAQFNGIQYDGFSFKNLIFPFFGYTPPYRISDVCSNKNGSINRYSYVKPIDTGSPNMNVFNHSTYAMSTKIINYRIGDALPSDYRAIYYPPTSYFKLSDFNGYDHNEYPCKLDLSDIPTQWDYDNYSEYFPIYHNGSQRALLQILVNDGLGTTYWDTALLIVAKKGNITRYFITPRSNFSSWSIHAVVGFSSELYEIFRQMDLGTYTCTVVGIIIPYTHPDKEQSPHEVFPSSGWSYPLIPECMGAKPYKEGVTISTPRLRCYWELELYDSSNNQDYYIPTDLAMTGFIRTPNTVLWSGGTFYWRDVLSVVGTSGGTYKRGTFVILPGDDSIVAEYIIPDYYHELAKEWIKPEINGTNASDLTYDPGYKQTLLRWDWPTISGRQNLYISFRYFNPLNRPDDR